MVINRKNLRNTRGFTLIELLVSVSLLVLVILGVGTIFRATGRAIRTSNATIETDAAVRAVMRQMAADLSRTDRRGFISIRNNWGTVPTRAQLTFLAHGGFSNRTGVINPQSSMLQADVQAHAALIWYGFGLTPEDTRAQSGNNYSENHPTTGAQDNPVQMSDISTAGTDINNSANIAILARHAFLLMPANVAGDPTRIAGPGGVDVPAHPDVRRAGQAITVSPTEPQAVPGSGRTSVASLTPGQMMARLQYEKYQAISIPAFYAMDTGGLPQSAGASQREGGFAPPLSFPATGNVKRLIAPYNGADYWIESRQYNYARKVLRNPLQGRDSSNTRDVVNGTLRMSSTLLNYVDQFTVDWTDGSTDSNGNLRWFGNTTRVGNSNSTPTIECLDHAREDAKTVQWPPVDYYSRGWTAEGGYNTGWSDSVMPALTDKAGELRQTPTYTPSQLTNGNPNPMYFYSGRNEAITRDIYTANFSFDTPWPKALRLMIRIDMAQTEITNFAAQTSKPRRSYSQVVWLPQ